MTVSILQQEYEEYKAVGTLYNLQGQKGKIIYAHNKASSHVAIKVVYKRKAYSESTGREELLREKSIMEEITKSGKPFLSQLLHSWDDEDNVYFTMRLYNKNLWQYMCKTSARPDSQLDMLYIAELIAALSNLHEIGIIHLDIKPENVLIAPSGHLALADFDLSQRWSEKKPSAYYIGTRGYMAPEVICGLEGGCDYPLDIWSMGLVIFEMVLRITGISYFHGGEEEVEKQILTHTIPLEQVQDALLEDLLKKMLDRCPERRWSAERLKCHGYFEFIDWESLEKGIYKVMQRPMNVFMHQAECINNLSVQGPMEEETVQEQRDVAAQLDIDRERRDLGDFWSRAEGLYLHDASHGQATIKFAIGEHR